MQKLHENLFPARPSSRPVIYAYSDARFPGMLKVGMTDRPIEVRMKEHYPTLLPGDKKPYKVEMLESAMRSDGTTFQDYDVHRVLEKKGFFKQIDSDGKKTEWFNCKVSDVKAAVVAVRERTENAESRSQTFKMRPEQERAVEKTAAYFENEQRERPDVPAKFLWNAKMRFGKTFASYELAKAMNFKKILILTFKPAVESAWKEDLLTHVDFEGWQFIARPESPSLAGIDEQYIKADKSRPIVCFGSFQDFLGTNELGGIKSRNEWVHTTNWDLVIFDEYHFGAWRDSAKKLFENPDEEKYYDDSASDADKSAEAANSLDESWLPISASHYLYLSGTPFRALSTGEFIEDQIFSWTYTDEQEAKENWPALLGKEPPTQASPAPSLQSAASPSLRASHAPSLRAEGEAIPAPGENPYAALPKMVLLAYKIPDAIQRVSQGGEFDEFDLNAFFAAEGKGSEAKFKNESYVQKWLDLIRGSYLEAAADDLKLGAEKPPMPYSDTRLLNALSHTLWFLPDVASCFAMKNLLSQKQNVFYHDYKINVCAGTSAGVGAAALEPVLRSFGENGKNPLESKTITLSCGKLTTGVTVKPWTGIFMLRNLKSPETYFQAAFRVQSPWETTDENGKKIILKKVCYVFDFALNRALKQISDYARNLDTKASNPEEKVADFIKFLPVLAYDGSSMRQVDAGEILDIAMSGTSATMLAKRWESALLVNVDNDTLRKIISSPDAMAAVDKIVGFRQLNKEIETIINKSESIKKIKKEMKEEKDGITKKELTEAEKEIKSMRKKIQEKLIKFATRIPVFMYLSDFREYTLQDVIELLEPELFERVTGLNVRDFNLLVSLNVFNESLMNDAVYKFKRYEDSSLCYTGIDRHKGEGVGLYSTVLSRSDYQKMGGTQTTA